VKIDFKIDVSQLDQLAAFTSAVRGNLEKDLARAITLAAYDARDHLKGVTPRYVDRPTKWTVNAVFVEPAKPGKLSARFGFKDTAVKGTPAAKYLQPMVGGGRRPLKPSERQLQGSGVLRGYEYMTPADVHPLKLNGYGNISGPTYVQVLSRLRGFSSEGSTQNVSGSKRSQRKRSARDYFLGAPGQLPRGIQARLGPMPKGTGGIGSPKGGRPITSNLPRGFHTVFYITRQPRYQATFPVRQILSQEFSRKFPGIFERLVFKRR
jgi:hypothetical protein